MKTWKKIQMGKLLNMLLILSLFFQWNILTAQENSISPIFGIAESGSSLVNELVAINQTLGNEISIENFSTQLLKGKNFTVSTLLSSNVDKMYILQNSNTLAVYDLPYFFDPNYEGQQNNITLSNNINDIEYHDASAKVYAYNLNLEELYTISTTDGSINSTETINFVSTATDFSLKTLDNHVILCGNDSGDTKILIKDLTTSIENTIQFSTSFKSFHLLDNIENNSLYAVATDMNDLNWLYKINIFTNTYEIISALPSCSNCGTEEYLYDKNALTIDWEKDHLLAVLNQKINGVDNYSLLTVDLVEGDVIFFAPLSKGISNLYFNKSATDLVFPGDANHDGVVNTRDIIPIGLKYSFFTIARFTQNTDWIGQHSFNTGTMAQGVDVKHADCNGDGIIDARDIDVIKLNYTSNHNSNKSASASNSDCDYPLKFSLPSAVYEDNDASINIKLGETFDIVNSVYTVSFTVKYDKNFVVPNTMHVKGIDSWYGNDSVNYTFLYNDNYLLGEMDVTMTGTDLLNRSGGGDIITTGWTMEDHVFPAIDISAQMDLEIDEVEILNFNQDILESCGTDTSVTVLHKDAVSINEANKYDIDIFPNPTSDKIYIKSDRNIKRVSLWTLEGKVLKNSLYKNSMTIDVNDVFKGVYFLKIETSSSSYLEKIIIE